MATEGYPVKVFRSLVMPNPPRPAGLIQRYREELQARHDARRTVNTDEAARDGQCGGRTTGCFSSMGMRWSAIRLSSICSNRTTALALP